MTEPLTKADVARYHQTGVVRIAEAFPPDVAAGLREILWRDAERRLGVSRTDPRTWSVPGGYWTGFDSVRALTARVQGPRLTDALDQLLGPGRWRYPDKWGGLLVSPPDPSPARWTLTDRTWHWDPPLEGAAIFCLLSTIAPRSGGTLLVEGSGHLLREWYDQLAPNHPCKLRTLRNQFLASHPYLRQLSGRDPVQHDPDDLLDQHIDSEGRRLKITEISGAAGDVFVVHANLIHARPVHTGTTPRFLAVEQLRPATRTERQGR